MAQRSINPVRSEEAWRITAFLLFALALLLLMAGSAEASTSGSELAVHDVWAHRDLGILPKDYTASVPAHGVVMLRVMPQGR